MGDCREMLATGSLLWAMVLLGLVAASAGLLVWHRLGSPRRLLDHPDLISPRCTLLVVVMLVVCLVIGCA